MPVVDGATRPARFPQDASLAETGFGILGADGNLYFPASGDADDAEGRRAQLISPGLYDGGTRTLDRQRAIAAAVGAAGVGVAAVGPMVKHTDGFYYDLWTPAQLGDASAGAHLQSTGQHLWNEATYDRRRGNTQATAIASGAYTSTQSSADIISYNARGVWVFFNGTTGGGGAGVIIRISAKDPVSSNYFLIATATTFASVGKRGSVIYPGVVGSLGGSTDIIDHIGSVIPRTFRIQVVHLDSTSWTYSVGYSLIV